MISNLIDVHTTENDINVKLSKCGQLYVAVPSLCGCVCCLRWKSSVLTLIQNCY